jgi:D-alanyl-D-alanine carboxypeptidase-like protein
MRRPIVIAVGFALTAASCAALGSDGSPPPSPEATRDLAAAPTEPSPAPSTTLDSPPSPEGADPSSKRKGPRDFHGGMRRIHQPMRVELVGRNWHHGCPVPLENLRILTIDHWGFDGEVHTGPMVVNELVAQDVLWVFERLFRAHFPIKEIALARKYRPEGYPDSKRSVTAAFNCRPVTDNPGTLSQHSYGWAIDINPLQNPYVRADGSVLRPSAKPYRDRSLGKPGMIHPGDVVVRSFARIGWEWGGNWSTIADYMHFSLSGR